MIVTLNIYMYATKNIFQSDSFLIYSPCPNLEGTKDALFYKFRRLMIGQNCSAMCTKLMRVAIEMHSRVKGVKCRAFCEAEARSVLFHNLVLDSKFERSERRHYTVSSSSCSWPIVRGVVYGTIA